jgi:hypothetical protein
VITFNKIVMKAVAVFEVFPVSASSGSNKSTLYFFLNRVKYQKYTIMPSKKTRSPRRGRSPVRRSASPPKQRRSRSRSPVADNEKYFKKDSTLSDEQKKYCRCLLKVEAQGRGTNPYAICTASVKRRGSFTCGEHYNYSSMPKESREAFARLHHMNPSDYSEQGLINALNRKVSNERTSERSRSPSPKRRKPAKKFAASSPPKRRKPAVKK